ncbi:hypothetical protein KAU88_03465 [Candidatus Bathyarchaeota archaeon]|nr:hypothetical protein [Candidatus Bathyarchaeota archaeon]
MKKAILLTILTSALAATLFTSAISPAQASIIGHNWIGQEHDYDPYSNSHSLTVFPENTIATLTVTVYNPDWYGDPDLNVSSVWIHMDWDENYNSTQCSKASPIVISPQNHYTFTITFTVPYVTVASNLVQHAYTIFVEKVNATSGPQQVSLHATRARSDFVVYSAVQKEAMMLYDEINMTFSYYDYSSFSSVVARSLWYNGSIHYQMGLDSHESSNFDSAKTHYETALDLLNQAIDTETAYDLDWQQFDNNYTRQWKQTDLLEKEANLTIREAIANASMIEADASMKTADAEFALAQAAMTQAYAWIVFGIGFVVFGFAAVIWASKRPSSP